MERRTFLTSTGAIGAGTLLSTLTAKTARGALSVNGLFAQNGSRGSNSGAKPLGTESDDLTPYTGAWGDAQLRHLLRRSMFGVHESQFLAAQQLGSMSAVVTQLLKASDLNQVPLPAKPGSWVDDLTFPNPKDPNYQVEANNFFRQHSMRINQIANWWFDLMAQESLSLREKMTMLWTNHFVTGSQTVQYAPYMFTYLQTCRQYSLGNFKDFALAISTDPAMLVYLNGDQSYVTSKKSFVNENYARELMELFTLGIFDPKTGLANYTEADIQNSARALTGWKPTTSAPFVGQFNSGLHDTGTKTFLGHTGNWALQDILNIIFAQGTPAGYTTAYWVCQKLYQEFVYYVPNKSVVDAMVTVMLANNFEIAPVMSALLSSAHFYDASVIGAQIKSPAQYMGSLVREFALTYPAFDPTDPPVGSIDTKTGYNIYTDTNPTLSIVTAIMNLQGQQLLNPPNVKGWPGGHNWISTGTFQNREIYSYIIVNNGLVNSKNNWNLAFNADTYAKQIPSGTIISAEALSLALENLSSDMAFGPDIPFGPLESGDLDTDIQGDYKNPKYQYNTSGVNKFATYLTDLPEFQLY